jgi:hypothetical protein
MDCAGYAFVFKARQGALLAVCNSWRNTEDEGIDKQGVYFNLCKAP